ncbi:MAG TPA: alpha/beta fold hydrolase [Gemmatirosa sp.]|nr:alpha/beta fold hydrolase [Gemmatirosa sp.]
MNAPVRPRRRRARRVLLGLAILLAAVAAALVRPDLPLATLRAEYAPPPSRFVRVQGMDVHYRDEGRGPAVVLLHGMGASLHTWDAWTAALRDSLRVIRLDLPGYGLTGPFPDGDYATARYLPFVDAVLDSLGVTRASFAGNSFGGEIAWRYALERPARVDRLILIDAAGYPVGEVPPLFRLAAAPVVGPLLANVGPRWLYAQNLRSVYVDQTQVTDALVDRYWELARRPGNRRAFLERALVKERFRFARVAELRAPTLIMWGERDPWIPVAMADTFARYLPQARVLRYPGVGHLPMEEAAARSAADARRFLLGGP